MKTVELQPIKETTEDYERMEARIKAAFKKLLYLPLFKELLMPANRLENAPIDSLHKALQTGRITARGGIFSGRFDAASSKALRDLGAVWDKKLSVFRLPIADQPMELRESISVAQVRFNERLRRIDKKLQKISPAEIAGNIKTSDLFISTLEKTDRKLVKSLKDYLDKTIVVKPLELGSKEREKIAEEWQNNMDLWINNFAEEEIGRLRKDIALSVVSGDRHEAIAKSLQRSYGVTANKAKFLARQETSLMMAKIKETRYTSVGVNEYKWRTVAGSKNHPVRPSHKILEGKVFRWDTPPITTAPDQPVRRNNPGQDYNCRCMAVPIVRFK